MTAIVLVQTWAGALCVAAALVALAASIALAVRRRHRRLGASTGIANVDRVADSKVFRRVRRRYLVLVGAELTALGIVAFAATGLAMRPVREHPEHSQSRNRDVMLCLDVSGSMSKLDADILQRFAAIANGLQGERIGLTESTVSRCLSDTSAKELNIYWDLALDLPALLRWAGPISKGRARAAGRP